MKECMYSYRYNRQRALIKKDRTGQFIFAGVIGIATIFSLYCLSQLVRI